MISTSIKHQNETKTLQTLFLSVFTKHCMYRCGNKGKKGKHQAQSQFIHSDPLIKKGKIDENMMNYFIVKRLLKKNCKPKIKSEMSYKLNAFV